MSPEGICPQCGKAAVFHQDEIDALLDGAELYCTSCGFERVYNEFLGEVLDGKHKELMQRLREEMEEDGE